MNQEILTRQKISRRELIRLGGLGVLSGMAVLSLPGCTEATVSQYPTPAPIVKEAPPTVALAAPTIPPYEVYSLPFTPEQSEYYHNHHITLETILRHSLLPNIIQGLSSDNLKLIENYPLLNGVSQEQRDYDLYQGIRSVLSEFQTGYRYLFKKVTFEFDDPLLIKRYGRKNPMFDIEMSVIFRDKTAKEKSKGALTGEVSRESLYLGSYDHLKNPNEIDNLPKVASKIIIVPEGDRWDTKISDSTVTKEIQQLVAINNGYQVRCSIDNSGNLMHEIIYTTRQ